MTILAALKNDLPEDAFPSGERLSRTGANAKRKIYAIVKQPSKGEPESITTCETNILRANA